MSFGNFKNVQFRAKDQTLRVVTSYEVDRLSTRVSPSGLAPNIVGVWVFSWEVFQNGQWYQVAESRTVTLKEGMWNCYRQAEHELYPGDTTIDRLDRKLAERGAYLPGRTKEKLQHETEVKKGMVAGQKFWITMVEGSTGAAGSFSSVDDARADAERRTQQTSKTVFVLEAIAAVGLPQPKVEWIDELELPVLEMPKAAYTPGEAI